MNRQYGALCGLAMLLVVINHAIHFGLQLSPVDGAWLNILGSIQAFGTFSVPAFLFISGTFVSYAVDAFSLKFVWNSLERILSPYLIWSVIFYISVLAMHQGQSKPEEYFKNLLVGYPYHFVPLLILCYLTAPVFARSAKGFGWLLLLAVGAYQACLLYLRYPGIFGEQFVLPDWTIYLKPPVLFKTMADWAIYFPMGVVFGAHNNWLKSRLRRWKWLALMVLLMLFVLSALNGFGMMTIPWARLVMPVPLMLLLPVIDRKSIPKARLLEQVGKRSYGLYLSHFVTVNIMVFLISKILPDHGRVYFIVFPLLLASALLVPLFLMDQASKNSQFRRIYQYVLG